MSIDQQPIRAYIDDVLSTKPVPGGGSVAALIGSQGAALIGMVIMLTTGKAFFQAYTPAEQQELHDLLTYFTEQKEALLMTATTDIEAYDGFLEAMRLPKTTDEEKATRKAAMQKAQRHALDVPLAMAECAYATLQRVEPVVRRGNANAISDVAVGSMCLQLAVRGGAYNARINLPGLLDQEYAVYVETRCEELVSESQRIVDMLLSVVEERLGS